MNGTSLASGLMYRDFKSELLEVVTKLLDCGCGRDVMCGHDYGSSSVCLGRWVVK